MGYAKYEEDISDRCWEDLAAIDPLSARHPEPNAKRYESMPGILGMVTALARGSGWDPETLWSLSPGAAEWYLVGIFQHRGVDMRIKTEHDEEFEEGLRREREAGMRTEAFSF